jgi:hypothetical protein
MTNNSFVRLENAFKKFKLFLNDTEDLSLTYSGKIQKHVSRIVIYLVLGVSIAWGIKLQLLEGFKYANARGFKGDFFEAMFGDFYWDGTGVFYGPVFTFEKKLLELFPNFITINFFAYLNILLAAISFLALIYATLLISSNESNVYRSAYSKSSKQSTKILFIGFCLALWLCASTLYYSFSVAANPEFLMLSLLSLSFLFVQKKKYALAYVLILFAVLTKVIPVIFICIFLLHPSRRGMKYLSAFLLSVVVALSVIQKLTIFETLAAILIPKAENQGKIINLTTAYQPTPDSWQSLGLNSAIARACGITCKVSLDSIQNISLAIVAAIYLFSVIVLMRNSRQQDTWQRSIDISFQFSLLFALLPIISPSSHPHYFLFLLPSFVGIFGILFMDQNHTRRNCISITVLGVYWVQNVPYIYVRLGEMFAIDLDSNLFLLDKAWSNLIYVLVIIVYRRSWTKSLIAKDSVQT